MIQVTDKYAINVLPECYAVCVFQGIAKTESRGRKKGDKIYVGNWYYGSLEDALIKISTLIEKDVASDCQTQIEALIARIERLHLETREYIKEAVKEYAHGNID